MRKVVLVLILLIMMAGCAVINNQGWQQSTLYFGMSCPDSSLVSINEWQQFVDTEISAEFPDGFTIINANGQWSKESGDIAREPSRVVVILHPGSRDTKEKIAKLRKSYKRRFSQESVLLTTQSIKVDF